MKHSHKEWSSELAARSQDILIRADKTKPHWIKSVDSALYWVLLFIAIVGNFILSVVLVPFLLVLKGGSLYLSLFFIGLSFGFIFSFILHGIDKLQTTQHIMASIFIPSIALINVGIFAVLSNKLIEVLKLSTPPHNAVLVGATYVFGYVLPYAFVHARKK